MEIKGTYRHYKGNNYEVIGEAIHTFSEGVYILYRQLYFPFRFWIMPKDMFLGYVYDGDKEIKRFTRIADNQKDCLTGIDLKAIDITHSENGSEYRIIGESDGKFILEAQRTIICQAWEKYDAEIEGRAEREAELVRNAVSSCIEFGRSETESMDFVAKIHKMSYEEVEKIWLASEK